ncbi:MAG: acyltransferase [Algoriphagus sp.]|uniref:acyltransferase n=1 Tax=Algoriphagus sp. TaxID=1872435 RepID=UPI0017A1025B|nr:acyltransferase [Algoriphagus sp.]NVJ85998.1 acyltransferase [Algoriphagus sp.]
MGFKIGKGSAILMGCKFYCAKGFEMGDSSVINANCILDSRGGLKIGNNVSISEQTILLTADHDMNSEFFDGRQEPIFIEDYVWIGTRATVLPGVNIGKGAVVAAGAVVNKSIDAFQVVAGVPAKFIKSRSQALNYKLDYRRLFQ